ncbi:MAG: hypothetical protein QHH09_01100 [Microgenomates group bacterium]|nr:hypothetical protein [Microgenomates group bacterium]
MKKSFLIISLLIILNTVLTIQAKTPAAVRNQNQIRTENQQEEQNLQIQTQEQEKLESTVEAQSQGIPKKISPRSEQAIQNMSEVAKKVEELLQLRTTQEGIGEQVREIAREQNQAQEKIKNQINKLEMRNKITKFLFGPDYQALKEIKYEIQKNQVRIKQLEQIKNKLINQSEIDKIQEAINAIIQQNTTLLNSVNLEEKTKSLFGWLLKLFNRSNL